MCVHLWIGCSRGWLAWSHKVTATGILPSETDAGIQLCSATNAGSTTIWSRGHAVAEAIGYAAESAAGAISATSAAPQYTLTTAPAHGLQWAKQLSRPAAANAANASYGATTPEYYQSSITKDSFDARPTGEGNEEQQCKAGKSGCETRAIQDKQMGGTSRKWKQCRRKRERDGDQSQSVRG